MAKDYLDKLHTKYPDLLSQANISFPVGWYNLVDCLCESITDHIEGRHLADMEFNPQAIQVKEKFGGLRFYLTYLDGEIDGMVKVAELLSKRICQECGRTGAEQIDDKGWIKTLCPECK